MNPLEAYEAGRLAGALECLDGVVNILLAEPLSHADRITLYEIKKALRDALAKIEDAVLLDPAVWLGIAQDACTKLDVQIEGLRAIVPKTALADFLISYSEAERARLTATIARLQASK